GRASRRSVSRTSSTSWRRSSRASGSPWTSSTDPDHVEEILMRRLTALLPVAIALALLWSAPAQAQGRGKEIVVGLGAEPRTMLAVTIVDWTTNNMLEHIYDRLLDRYAKTLKPKPMLATGWKIVNDTTWEFALRQGVKFHNGEVFN